MVENAENLGLSQLYQLRGRVGRSNRIAYAYITYRKDRVLSEISTKRLNAIREFTELGSGFKITARDFLYPVFAHCSLHCVSVSYKLL